MSALFAVTIGFHVYINRNNDKSYVVLNNISIAFQNLLRDLGIVRDVADVSTTIAAASLCLFQPSLAYRFYKLHQRTRFIQYGPTSGHVLEVFPGANVQTSTDNARKIMLFVHGGGWGTGKPWMYRLIAEGLGNLLNADTIVNVGYPMYPLANMKQQSESIASAVSFIRASPEFNVTDIDTIVLAAHSSGAHECALSLLLPLQTKLNNQTTSIPNVDVFIGLSGVYDIAKHFVFEAGRGVHQLSPMQGAAGGKLLFDSNSPTLIAQNLAPSRLVLNESIDKLPMCILLHGTEDTVVPHSSTVDFAKSLEKLVGTDKVLCKIIKCEHAQIVIDLMFDTNTVVRETILSVCNNFIK